MVATLSQEQLRHRVSYPRTTREPSLLQICSCRQVLCNKVHSIPLLELGHHSLSNVDCVRISLVQQQPTWPIDTFFNRPNLITLIGLGFMVSNVLLVVYYVPDLGTDAPNWIYFSFAAGLWLYSTFDNVDGKQARRTGTSSPLGELFDHGCDALNTAFVSILQCAALGLGHTQSSLIIFIVTVFGFYMSTAEEYYTKVLYLGVVNGPTEGILLTCFAFIWSGFNGK